jgi:hypothetical protein
MNLGIDIGRVLIAPGGSGGRADTSFIQGSLADALETPPMDGAIDAVARLVDAFDRRVWLISKCYPRVQDRTRRWLDHHAFYERTNLRRDRVVFCLERSEKAGHCERLGVTSFIDDRIDVLEAMRGRVPRLFLFGEQRVGLPEADWYQRLLSWNESLQPVMAILDRT